MRAFGVDAFTIGNHEFDFGLGALRKLIALGGAEVPVISCNIDGADGKPFTAPSVQLDLGNGHKLKVIGITAADTPLKTVPSNVDGLTFHAPAARVAAEKARLEAVPGPTIVLSHCGWRADLEVAQQVPGLPLIVGGHDQILLFPARRVDDTWLVQAYEKCKVLGRVDLTYDYASRRAEVFGTTMYPITTRLPEDPAIKELVARYAGKLEAEFAVQIATAEVFLDGERGRIRYDETNLGDLIADVMRARTAANVALLNAGSIRGSINKGPVTIGDVLKAFPYGNELMTVELDGATLRQVLTRAIQGERIDEDGGFLHVSGLELVIEGKRLASVKIGDAALDDAARYSVAITSFVKSGGDGYHWFKPLSAVQTGVMLRDALIDEIRRRKTIAIATDGRIVRR